MKRSLLILGFLASVCLAGQTAAWAGRAPGMGFSPDHKTMTNPAGAAIVNATGAIRQVVHGEDDIQRRYLVIAKGRADKPGPIVQVQLK